MARLSNETISSIAQKMTAKTKEAVTQLETDYREAVTVAYENQIPEEVKNFATKYKEFIRHGTEIHLEGHGFRWTYVNATRPIIKDKNGNANLILNEKIADKIKKIKLKWQAAETAYDSLLVETKQALSALGTHNRIKENLPEAAEFLPPPMSNALVVNFTSLQNKLKLQPDTKKIAAVTN